MKKLKKAFILLLSIIFMLSNLSVYADTNTSEPKNLKVVNVTTIDPESLDPQKEISTGIIDINTRIMEGLMRRNGKNVIPGIASKYEVSKDGLNYTFYLRDAYWTDGKPVTASDFAYSWQRALDPKTDSSNAYMLFYIKNAEKYNNGKIAANQLGIKVINQKTLKITLENPTPYFIGLTTNMVYLPARKDIVEKYKDKYFTGVEYIVSNGPFELTEWERDSYIKVEKNPKYWNAKAIKIDVINAHVYAKGENYKEDYINGDLDIFRLFSDDKSNIPKDEIKKIFDGTVWYVQFNNSDKAKIVSNSNIRKALTLSINRQQFINESKTNSVIPALSLVSPEIIPGKTKSFRGEAGNLIKDNDIKTAKTALSLGLKQLKLKKLPVLKLMVDNNDTAKKQAETLTKMWKKNLGIDVKVESLNFKDRLTKMYDRNYQITLAGWGPDYYDALTYLDMFNSSVTPNSFGYKNTEYNNMIKSIKKELNKSKRIDLLMKAEKKIINDYVVAPLYFRYSEIACKPYLKNVQSSDIGAQFDVTYAELVDGVKSFTYLDSKLTIKANPCWYMEYFGTSDDEIQGMVIFDSIEEAAASIFKTDTAEGLDLDSYYNLFIKGLMDSYTKSSFTNKTKLLISGFPSIRFNLLYIEDGKEMIALYTIIKTPNGIYHVIFNTSESSKFKQRRPEFEKMIESIKIVQ